MRKTWGLLVFVVVVVMVVMVVMVVWCGVVCVGRGGGPGL